MTHALAGGALGGVLSNAQNAAAGVGPLSRMLAKLPGGLGKALPEGAKALGGGVRGGAAAGLGVYLARKLLTNPNPATRPVTRLERERFIPGSMQADIQP